MASHMGVQLYATNRNKQAELLVDYILQVFMVRLYEENHISNPVDTLQQIAFKRDDCSDVFDHYAELELTRTVGNCKGRIQIWGQTTCYKGNTTGKPEPNKTYEIRETLIESLGLRRWLREEGISFRTLQ